MPPINLDQLPRHVAIIMDGNGRWARKRLRNRLVGHEEGANSVREIVRCCREIGIPFLTLYAFSKENWQRPETEVKGLWLLLKRFLKSELPELIEKEIRLCHIGDPDNIPDDVRQELYFAVEQTARFEKLVLSLAINYGGRQEITRAAALFATDVKEGKRKPGELSPELFSQYLYTSSIPDPDLVIRTGGEYRISNFLLYQIAYAEIHVTDVLWPDFRKNHFFEAIKDFAARERRFGKTTEQVRNVDT